MRPRVNSQHILHRRYEGAIRLGRNDPALFAVRLENVFFSVRPIVLSLARSTILSSTTADSRSFSVQRTRPFGGSEQASAMSLASLAPSKMRCLAEAGECLLFRADSTPSATSCCRVRATLLTLVSKAAAIRLSLHPSPVSEASAFSRMRALTNWPARCLPLWISVLSRSRSSSLSFTMYFFTPACFAVTMHLRRCGAIDSENHAKINDIGH